MLILDETGGVHVLLHIPYLLIYPIMLLSFTAALTTDSGARLASRQSPILSYVLFEPDPYKKRKLHDTT